jgi:hypothetical protein
VVRPSNSENKLWETSLEVKVRVDEVVAKAA